MNDPDLLRAAAAAAGMSSRRFAAEVLDVDERTSRRWLNARRELQGTVRVVCTAVVSRPAIAAELADALAIPLEMDGGKLLESAIAVAGLDPPRFAAELLDVDMRSVERTVAGEREIHGTVRVVCTAILARPAIAGELAAARGSISSNARPTGE